MIVRDSVIVNRICEKALMHGCQQHHRLIDYRDLMVVFEHELLKGGDAG